MPTAISQARLHVLPRSRTLCLWADAEASPAILSLPAADQVPLMEDLEQIFLRSWRESHLTEIRQYQQAPPQPCPPVPSAVAPVTSAQLPWLAGLAASSCNDSVHVIECTYSLAEGLSEMFRLLIEGKLAKTNYVVIVRACRSPAIDSCVAVTGEPGGCGKTSCVLSHCAPCLSRPALWQPLVRDQG